MSQTVASARRFRVHARHLDRHHGRMLEEATFEAAAVAYGEDFVPADDEFEITIVVHEVATGYEHCFMIDLESGQAAPVRLEAEPIRQIAVE